MDYLFLIRTVLLLYLLLRVLKLCMVLFRERQLSKISGRVALKYLNMKIPILGDTLSKKELRCSGL